MEGSCGLFLFLGCSQECEKTRAWCQGPVSPGCPPPALRVEGVGDVQGRRSL